MLQYQIRIVTTSSKELLHPSVSPYPLAIKCGNERSNGRSIFRLFLHISAFTLMKCSFMEVFSPCVIARGQLSGLLSPGLEPDSSLSCCAHGAGDFQPLGERRGLGVPTLPGSGFTVMGLLDAVGLLDLPQTARLEPKMETKFFLQNILVGRL